MEDLRRIIELLTEIRDLLKDKPPTPRARVTGLAEELPKLAVMWNQYTDTEFPKVESISKASTRYKAAQERWKEKPREEYWWGAIMKINASRFCKGENSRKWVANFEFFVRPDAGAMILEGKYDDKEPIKEQKKVIPYEIDPITGEVIIRG